mgnify:FL=1
MNATQISDPRRKLPAVHELLEKPVIKKIIKKYSRQEILEIIKSTLAEYRAKVVKSGQAPEIEEILFNICETIKKTHKQDLKPVINATGIILHTGLGRAPLPKVVTEGLAELSHCCNLQIDLESGDRGRRHYRVAKLLCQITGAEAAHIVNNNAAATLLILTALCREKEVIISRGQLIEIGGSYRLPDCIHQSGAKMMEVGTTNKTHLYDYENALSEETGAIMHVHPSNYHIQGFSKQVPVDQLVKLKKQEDIIIIDDLGCGAIEDMAQWDLPHEPTAKESIAAGADLVCFSGDKLIGGPQAGIIIGKKELIHKLKKHPLARMLRAGKMTDMALEKTLRLFLDRETLLNHNPTYKMLTTGEKDIADRVQKIKRKLENMELKLNFRIIKSKSAVGGGSMPTASLPTSVLAISSDTASADKISYLLRDFTTPVIAYIENQEVVLDFRTILENEEQTIVAAIKYVNSKI